MVHAFFNVLKVKILVLLIIATAVSCQTNNNTNLEVYESFPINEKLTHKIHKIKEPLTPRTIHVIDSLVLMVDYNRDYAFHFYNLSDWSYLGGYGKIGDGPNEVKMPRFHGQFVREGSEMFFWISDFRTYDLKKVNLYDLLATGECKPEVKLKLPPVLTWTYNDVYAISDNEFVGTVEGDISQEALGVESGRFFRFNSLRDTVTWLPNFPIQETEVEPEKVGYLYSSFSSFNTDRKQIVSAMKFFNRIDIVDAVKEDVLTIAEKGEESLREVDLKDDRYLIPQKVVNYNGLNYSTSNFIYQLHNQFSGSDSKDFFNGREKAISEYELRVFNWNGESIYKAKLDKRHIGRFFVDENTWTMYAINAGREKEEDLIISYQLANLLKD